MRILANLLANLLATPLAALLLSALDLLEARAQTLNLILVGVTGRFMGGVQVRSSARLMSPPSGTE